MGRCRAPHSLGQSGRPRTFGAPPRPRACASRNFDARNQAVLRMAALASETGRHTRMGGNPDARRGKRSTIRHMPHAEPGSRRRPSGADRQGARRRESPRPQRNQRNRHRSSSPRPSAARRGSRSDRTALDAIAARQLKDPPRKRAQPMRAAADTGVPGPNARLLSIRELCHELRNPLTVILGFAERISDTAPPGRGQESCALMRPTSSRALSLRWRSWATSPAACLRPEDEADHIPSRLDIKATVESCLRLIAPLAKQAGLKLSRSTGRGPAAAAGRRARAEAGPAQRADERRPPSEDRRQDPGDRPQAPGRHGPTGDRR